MKKLLRLIVLFALTNISFLAIGQGTDCSTADPFCTGTTYTFPNNTGVPDLGAMDCLGSSPNPAWYYLQIADPGNLDIFISQVDGGGTGIDVDFDLWGPFTSVSAGCTALPSTSSIDCSYSTSATETANIVGASTGEFYLLLLTNYSNQPGTITFSQTGGLGTTDCSILCAAPDASAGTPQTISCLVSTVTLSGSSTTSGVTYSWTGPGGFTSSLQNPNVGTAGTYTVTVTDPANAGCPSTATQVVNASAGVPDISTGATLNLTCTTTIVDLTGGSTTGGVTYSWSGPAGFSSTVSSPTGITTPGTYTLTVTDPSNSCIATSTQIINTNTTAPNATAGTVQTLTCTVLAATLSSSSTTAGVTYSWTGPAGFTSSVQNPAGVVTSGTYTVTITDPSNGCTSTTTQDIISNTVVPNIGTGTTLTLTCLPPTVNLMGSSTTSGAVYSWSGPGAFSSTSPGAAVSVAGTYTLTVTDPTNGCTATGTEIVNPSVGAPNASAGSIQTLTCTTTTVILNASSTTTGVTYSWSGPGIVSGGATTTPTVNASGSYTVTVTDPSNGCTSTTSQTVNTNTTPPNANAGSNMLLPCTVNAINLDGSGSSSGPNNTYIWTTADGLIVSGGTSNSPSIGLPGTYTITVTDINNGCTSTDVVVVTGDIIPVASFTASPNTGLAPLLVDFTNTSSGATTYGWNFGNGNSSSATNPLGISYDQYGTYTVTLIATNANGCSDTAFATIFADAISAMIIPNIFSPNGDLQNELFAVSATAITSFEGQIYDRWGLKMFEWTDVNSGWNGKSKNGGAAPDGTYFYIITAKGINGKEYNLKGYLSLVR